MFLMIHPIGESMEIYTSCIFIFQTLQQWKSVWSSSYFPLLFPTVSHQDVKKSISIVTIKLLILNLTFYCSLFNDFIIHYKCVLQTILYQIPNVSDYSAICIDVIIN